MKAGSPPWAMSLRPWQEFLGGLLAGITLRAPYFAQTFVAFIALPAAITLVEPARKVPLIKAGMMEIVQIARFALIHGPPLETKHSFQCHYRYRHPDHGLVCTALF